MGESTRQVTSQRMPKGTLSYSSRQSENFWETSRASSIATKSATSLKSWRRFRLAIPRDPLNGQMRNTCTHSNTALRERPHDSLAYERRPARLYPLLPNATMSRPRQKATATEITPRKRGVRTALRVVVLVVAASIPHGHAGVKTTQWWCQDRYRGDDGGSVRSLKAKGFVKTLRCRFGSAYTPISRLDLLRGTEAVHARTPPST